MKKYIDAEGVMRVCYDGFLKTGNKAYREIFALVEAVPVEDVQKVEHGRWLDLDAAPGGLFYATCSVCGERHVIEVANYCPMCGANLSKEENE